MSTPTVATHTIETKSAPKRHARTYTLEVQCEPWAVLPLATMLAERVIALSNGRLSRGMPEAELTLTFESFETSPTPEFGHAWIQQLDNQLLIGFGWSCDDDGRRARPQGANQYVVVALNADTVDGLTKARAIVDVWDRDRGALVKVDQDTYTDGTVAVVVTVDADVTPDELATLATRLEKLGTPRVVNPNRV